MPETLAIWNVAVSEYTFGGSQLRPGMNKGYYEARMGNNMLKLLFYYDSTHTLHQKPRDCILQENWSGEPSQDQNSSRFMPKSGNPELNHQHCQLWFLHRKAQSAGVGGMSSGVGGMSVGVAGMSVGVAGMSARVAGTSAGADRMSARSLDWRQYVLTY